MTPGLTPYHQYAYRTHAPLESSACPFLALLLFPPRLSFAPRSFFLFATPLFLFSSPLCVAHADLSSLLFCLVPSPPLPLPCPSALPRYLLCAPPDPRLNDSSFTCPGTGKKAFTFLLRLLVAARLHTFQHALSINNVNTTTTSMLALVYF